MTAIGMLRFGLRVSSPRVAAASNPTKDRKPNTTPRPTPLNPPGEDATRNTLVVLPLPAVAIASAPSTRKITTSITSNVRARLTDPRILPRDSQQTPAIAARLSHHHGIATCMVDNR